MLLDSDLVPKPQHRFPIRVPLLSFQKWLEEKNCYVFTINGFPYGNFHGERVKEQVYRPDWSTSDRLEYTVLLFEILEKLLQPGEEGSVSTLPGSFKEFHSAGEIPKLCFSKSTTLVPGKLSGLKG